MGRLIRHNNVQANGALVSVRNSGTVASVTYENCKIGTAIIVEASEKGRGNLVYATADAFIQITIDRSQLKFFLKKLKTENNQALYEKIALSFETTAETKQMGENPKFPLYECIKNGAKIVISGHRNSKLLIFRADTRAFIAREGAFHSSTAGIDIKKLDLPSFDNKLLAKILKTMYFQSIRGYKHRNDPENFDIFIIEVQGDWHREFLRPGDKLSINPSKLIGFDEYLEIVDTEQTAEAKEDRIPAGQDYNVIVQGGPAGGFVYVADISQEKLDIPERHVDEDEEEDKEEES